MPAAYLAPAAPLGANTSARATAPTARWRSNRASASDADDREVHAARGFDRHVSGSMLSRMSKPVLLVTGGARGIGAATCRLAGARGYRVAVNYLQNTRAAEAVVTSIEQVGGEAVALQGNVAQPDDVARLF